MEHNSFIDYCIIGEGDDAFPELLDWIENENKFDCSIPNVWSRRSNGDLIANRMRLLKDISILPFMDLEGWKFEKITKLRRNSPNWPCPPSSLRRAQESKKAAREKARAVVAELKAMKLKEAAKKAEDGIDETLTYYDFPSEHWTRIRTNNVIERLNREIRRRTRVIGTFPDGNSALMLVCARLRHVAGTQWGNKKYMNMKHLESALEDAFIAG